MQLLIGKYADVFVGLGSFAQPYEKKHEIKIEVTPKVCPVCKIHYNLRHKLKVELDKLFDDKIIKKSHGANGMDNSY